MSIINVSDIVQPNGLTWRENNLAVQHTITLGSLVEIKDEDYNEDGGVRLFVVNHSRDCDGTPLYDLSFDKEAQTNYDGFLQAVKNGEYSEPQYGNAIRLVNDGLYRGAINRHYSADSLVVIKAA